MHDLFILRHGETEWNAQGRMQGGLDSDLTARGRKQAAAMAAILKREAPGCRLVSSPQGRALATARYVGEALGVSVKTDTRIREIGMGDWAGLSREEIDATWPASDPNEHFLDFYRRAPNGEGFVALWERSVAFLSEIEEPTIIVTHGMTSRVMRSYLLGYGPDRLDVVRGGQGVVFRIKNGKQRVLAK